MIKLEKSVNAPQILQDKQKEWTDHLLSLVSKYGSYKEIPKEEKASALSHYRHKDITTPLFDSSYQKCAFCESTPKDSGNIEVEHFYPKSIYHDKTFDWENFLPSCRKCNDSKLAHDVGVEPILNPYESDFDPSEHFEFTLARMKGKTEIAKMTIDVCGLKSRLYDPYSNLIKVFCEYEQDLEEALQELEVKDTERKKQNQLRKISESIARIENLMQPTKKYSYFCSCMIKDSEIYNQAKTILSLELQEAY
ncbi:MULTISPECIES: HNH endonuclease [unclassified Acinetobacter]|uniref:HNH endonuclease n=1 Tax=unclassified Acinetobacter TaxID=196816 RepID=UPI0015D10BA8|nr:MULTISPECIES: HNH endonuclease [unclassified Acinetobacter]